MLHRLFKVVLTAWAGSLWSISALVAPALFRYLPERSMAGEMAGHLFTLEAWLGLIFALASAFILQRLPDLKSRLNYLFILLMASGPLISELVLRTAMDAAKTAGNMQRFGALHGVSALLFLISCLSALMLVWRTASSAGPSSNTSAK